MNSIVSRFFLTLSTIACLIACREDKKLPPADADNGGLFLPDGFDALVVTDSIGRARHLAVNDNGDIYVKLTYNDSLKGKGGTVGLRDLNGDGKADSVVLSGSFSVATISATFIPLRTPLYIFFL